MTSSFPILTIIVFLPLVGALVVALIPAASDHLAKPVGLAVAVVELAFVAYLVVDFQGGKAGFQFISQHSWISDFGISLEGRRGRDLAVPRGHDRPAVPDRHGRPP